MGEEAYNRYFERKQKQVVENLKLDVVLARNCGRGTDLLLV